MNRTLAIFLSYFGIGYLFECVRDELSTYYDEKLDNTMRLLEDANEKIKRENLEENNDKKKRENLGYSSEEECKEKTNREELGYLSED